MKEYTCCFTGHRMIPPHDLVDLSKQLEEEITKLIHRGYRFFGCGGAIGFDTLSAQIVLKLRNKYPHIRLILVLPCKQQTKYWTKHDRNVYEQIYSRADKIVYIAEQYDGGCMRRRNEHLVNHSSMCVSYQYKRTGGTAYTVNYAKKMGLYTINLFQGRLL